MDRPPAFQGLVCRECGTQAQSPTAITCEACGAHLAARVRFADSLDRAAVGSGSDQYAFAPLLPVGSSSAVTMGEGATPLVDCPDLAGDAGSERLLLKDEGANPTGSLADRGASIAVTAVASAGAETVALPTTGHGGRSVAAYAGRAGLGSQVYLPSRAPFDCKAMVNVHGGEMTVVGGRYPDAAAAFEDEREPAWATVGPASPFRAEGMVSLYGEVLATLDWAVPDALVVPASHGTTVVGLARAIERLRDAGLSDGSPDLVVAQPSGCSPIADAIDGGVTLSPVENPDTIAGTLEVPAPALGQAAVDVVRDLGGRGVTVADDDAVAAAVEASAGAGLEVGVAGGVALAAAGAATLDGADTVVVLNPTAGGTESDILRSHLMGQGG